jgi:hypothetical protein
MIILVSLESSFCKTKVKLKGANEILQDTK